jgi:hypothetical protein
VATRAKRLHPARTHRDAVLTSLPEEQRPVAEQVLRGGIPAVRQAVEEHNAKARAAGEPEVRADALVGMAEDLQPALRAAEWRDRAEAALADVETVSLRDLRAVVAGSDAGRDDACRQLATSLREAFDRRSSAEREVWLGEIQKSLTENRVVRALRVSSRPPEPGVRFPPDLAHQLSEAASRAMGPDVAAERWTAVLDAVVSSPVRLSVRPEGLPKEPGQALTDAVRQATARVPGLENMLEPGGPPASPAPVPPPPPAPPKAAAAPPGPVPPPPVIPPAAPATPEAAPPTPEAAPPTPEAGSPPPASSGDDRDDPVLVEELGQPLDQP